MMTYNKYFKTLKRELFLLISKKKNIPDFITRFLFLLDVIPDKIPDKLLQEIEKFNYTIGCYEPDLQIRMEEPTFVSEERVIHQAEKLLMEVEKILEGNNI